MKKGTPISAIMSKDVITLNRTDDLETAELLFKRNKIRHIPVVSGKEIIGMLSLTDLLRISFAGAMDDEETSEAIVYNMFTVEQIMAKNLISVASTTTVREVAELLSKKEFHAIPVVDNGELMGIVTTTDLINYMIQQFDG